jgi:hypothetical protein
MTFDLKGKELKQQPWLKQIIYIKVRWKIDAKQRTKTLEVIECCND